MNIPFKQRLQQPQKLRGIWLVSGSPTVTEALSVAGWDFLVLDLEHAPVSPWQVADHLRAARMGEVPVIVRLPDDNPVFIKQVMDAGATHLMVPFIESAQQAQQVVGATQYAPRGTRGLARVIRASHYGSKADYIESVANEVTVIAQLETLSAMSILPQVAKVPGVDAIFLGPGDLSAALGVPGQAAHPEVTALLAQGFAQCQALGVPVGTILPNAAMVREAFASGCGFASVSSDIGLLLAASRQVGADLEAGR